MEPVLRKRGEDQCDCKCGRNGMAIIQKLCPSHKHVNNYNIKAAEIGGTCKALKRLMAQHWR